MVLVECSPDAPRQHFTKLGVFEMSESGLAAVSNPSQIFLSDHFSDSDVLAGLAIAVVVDGSRTFLIEIQSKSLINEGGGSSWVVVESGLIPVKPKTPKRGDQPQDPVGCSLRESLALRPSAGN
ncbi:Lon protease (S16) C-terminal proteolytic domain [Musa troglodytarum]|uniref:Lon protease (S16) C-terminal proteolytic domain n=1 Tax=Musa troglodytarum TaxID=320322 RepID=A0A9E7KHH3_9LILI|nr:Lon protease (S16) C-terminal proteolytic domain [Musa troglodytarum]